MPQRIDAWYHHGVPNDAGTPRSRTSDIELRQRDAVVARVKLKKPDSQSKWWLVTAAISLGGCVWDHHEQ